MFVGLLWDCVCVIAAKVHWESATRTCWEIRPQLIDKENPV